ncbi:MAG: DNA alkylation repair protein [Pseudomonadota bacterium]
MAAGYSLKDDLFNRTTVSRLGQEFEDGGVFEAAPFVDAVMAGLAPLELKERIAWIAEVLADFLPRDFPDGAAAIQAALPPPLDPTLTDDDFGHFIHAPLGVFVERHGITQHVALSLDLLEAITQRFSMEFSIRAFLNAHEAATLERMRDWVVSDNYHVRRLVSEGTRPRLPWGQKVGLTSAQTLPLLDQLHADQARFVTRSVSNHLNDISKVDPETVVDRLAKWQSAGRQEVKELDWMRRHTLRGLIKAGHAGAMAHLGYDANVDVSVRDFKVSPTAVELGGKVEVVASFTTPKDAPMIVDYVIDFVKANGSTAPKTSKWKVLEAKGGTSVTLKKSHVFKANATTFKLYPGKHRISLQINGRQVASCEVALI